MKYIIEGNKIKRIDIFGLILKGSITNINKERRTFSGFSSVEIIDRQGDFLPVSEFEKVMPILMKRGALIMDSHSNHPVGKIISYEFKNTDDNEKGLYLTAEIFSDYPTDDKIWEQIKNGELSGFSLGGKAGVKTPTCTNVGCYNVLGEIEAWEFSVVSRPANQGATIKEVNKLAKASDVIDEVISSIIQKERVYIKTPAEAPRNTQVYTGERGGKYYETEELPKSKIPKIDEEIGNIGETFDVSESSLKSNSTNIKVNSKDVYIGAGVGYYPKEGGTSEMFNERVVIGPKSWIGKNAWEIPEIKEQVDKDFENLSTSQNGGNFSQAQYTQNQGHISKVLYKYKSPFVMSEPLRNLVNAYFTKSKINPPDESFIMTYQKANKVINNQKDYIKLLQNYHYERADKSVEERIKEFPQFEFKTKLNTIRDNEYINEMINQDIVNEFVSEIQRTQHDLKQRFPNKKFLTLFRGVSGDYADEIKNSVMLDGKVRIKTNQITSWTESQRVAQKFGEDGIVIKKEIPIEKILFSHYTSPYIRTSDFAFGGEEESEIVVGIPEEIIEINREEVL